MFQERIRKALEDATLTINGEVSASCIQQDFNIFAFEPFANKEGLAEQMDIAVGCDLTKESDPSSGNGKRLVRDQIIERQLTKFGSSAILDRSQAAQAGLHVLCIDGFFQSLQFAFERGELSVVPLK